jgi:hypothetical protein
MAGRYSLPDYWWIAILLVLFLMWLVYRLIRNVQKDELRVVDLKRLHKERMMERARRMSPILIVIGILILFLIALVFFFTGLNRAVEPEKSPSLANLTEIKTVFEWNKNHPYIINLSRYTIDVDDDLIKYKVTQLTNISVKVNGSIVTFTPEEDFIGERVINFIAEDSKGARAYSPDILLSVVDKEPLPMMVYSAAKRFLMKTINYVILSAFLIAVIVILLILRIKESRKFKAVVIKGKRKL